MLDGSYADTSRPETWTSLTALLAQGARRDRIGNCADRIAGRYLHVRRRSGRCGSKADGTLEDWVVVFLSLMGATYYEVSPSGTGIKVYFRVADVDAFRALLGDQWNAAWPQEISDDNLGDKTPQIELHAGHRYYCLTGAQWYPARQKNSG